MKVKSIAALTALFITVPPAKDLHILIKMIPAQEAYFKEVILREFEQQKKCTVKVSTFQDNGELIDKLKISKPPFDVVKVPMGMAHALASDGLVKPLYSVVDEKKARELKKQFFLMKLAEVNGELYYVPRKFETRIMVYLKSRVRDAVQNWEQHRESVEAVLKKAVGRALPPGYTLEEDPSLWDYHDVLVCGHYWAAAPGDGNSSGRIAHRGKDYSGTALGLMDRCFQMGATHQEVLNASSSVYTEVLQWESLYTAAGVYNRDSWAEGWDGSDLWKGFKTGEIYLSFLTQVDCYALHGTGEEGHVKSAADLGFAVMPEAVAPETARRARRSISTGGWLWGIGHASKRPGRALDLIRHLTSYRSQVGEMERFGMIPVRKEILGRSTVTFGKPWQNDVFKTSMKQLKLNGQTALPYAGGFRALEKRYISIWKKVVTGSANGFLGKDKITALQKGK